MNIRMRSGTYEVNGEMVKMNLSAVKIEVGSVYQTLRGEWKTVAAEYGKFDTSDGPMFGYETRPATAFEIEIANKPIDRKVESAFWNDFFDNTDNK